MQDPFFFLILLNHKMSSFCIYKFINYILIYKFINHKKSDRTKKIKNSHNYNKLKQQIAHLYKKLTNARKYLTHQITVDKQIIVT